MSLGAVAGVPMLLKAGEELTNSIFDIWIRPKLERLKSTHEINNLLFEDVSENLKKYLLTSYNEQLKMNTIVFQNQQKKIDELYIPLTVQKTGSNIANEEIMIDSFKEEFIPRYKKVILIDNAGMGKSTLMKYLFVDAIRKGLGVPIFIELRKIKKDTDIIKYMFNYMKGLDDEYNYSYILKLIERGDFIFFLDGYDEISGDDKQVVTEKLQEFIRIANENLFIISSREEKELGSFGNFQSFKINSLLKEEAFDLIKKYDNNGELSQEIIDKIENDEDLEIVKEFLASPLMTSLLYLSYTYKRDIPYKKSMFYRQIYEALFDAHDLSKGGAYKHEKKSGLDMDDFNKVLRHIAFNSFFKLKKVLYTREELIGLIELAQKKYPYLKFKANHLLHDLISSVPIFSKDGLEYRWTHKSFQEYFTVLYICTDIVESREGFLKRLSQSDEIDKYYNILDFCYDIDVTTFRKVILVSLVDDYIKYIEEEKYIEHIRAEDILLRKKLTYSAEYIFIGIDESQYASSKDMFKEIQSSKCVEKQIGKRVNTMYAGSMLEEFIIGFIRNSKDTIIKLLFNKREDIFETICCERERSYKIEGLKEKEVKLADLDAENILNQKDNFSKVNKVIFRYKQSTLSHHVAYILSYEKCKKALVEIQGEVQVDEFCDIIL